MSEPPRLAEPVGRALVVTASNRAAAGVYERPRRPGARRGPAGHGLRGRRTGGRAGRRPRRGGAPRRRSAPATTSSSPPAGPDCRRPTGRRRRRPASSTGRCRDRGGDPRVRERARRADGGAVPRARRAGRPDPGREPARRRRADAGTGSPSCPSCCRTPSSQVRGGDHRAGGGVGGGWAETAPRLRPRLRTQLTRAWRRDREGGCRRAVSGRAPDVRVGAPDVRVGALDVRVGAPESRRSVLTTSGDAALPVIPRADMTGNWSIAGYPGYRRAHAPDIWSSAGVVAQPREAAHSDRGPRTARVEVHAE